MILIHKNKNKIFEFFRSFFLHFLFDGKFIFMLMIFFNNIHAYDYDHFMIEMCLNYDNILCCVEPK